MVIIMHEAYATVLRSWLATTAAVQLRISTAARRRAEYHIPCVGGQQRGATVAALGHVCATCTRSASVNCFSPPPAAFCVP